MLNSSLDLRTEEGKQTKSWDAWAATSGSQHVYWDLGYNEDSAGRGKNCLKPPQDALKTLDTTRGLYIVSPHKPFTVRQHH